LKIRNLFFILFPILLFSEQIKIYRDGIVPRTSSDESKYIRIYLNHENSSQNQVLLSGVSPSFSIDLPVANRWKVLGARAEIHYTPSIALEEERSFLAIKLHDYTLKQYQLIENKYVDDGEKTVMLKIPHERMEKHNLFSIQLYQHYFATRKEDMTSAPEVWTQINLEDSFVELEVEKREIPKELSSLIGRVFDIYNPVEQRINYVFPNMEDKTIYNYAFFSSVLGKILQYRQIDFTVSNGEFKFDRDNLIIATTDQLKEIFDKNGFGFQIRGNVNIYRNPKDKTLAIIIITAKSEEKLKKVLFSTFGLDMNLNSGNSKIIKDILYPKKAKPYSSPEFVGSGQKISFSDLGYETKTFSGFFTPPLDLEFKLYPDLFFPKKEKGDIYVDYIFPIAVTEESIANVFINDVFVSQVKMLEEKDSQTLKSYLMMDSKTSSRYPADLLKGGKNKLSVQLKMIPMGWNPESLKATVLKESYFEIPEAQHWIAMADLKDFISSAFPYSIYPDLQDTLFLLTDKKSHTIEALMQIARFLGESVKYPPYYMEVRSDLEEGKEKNIIMVGTYNEEFKEIYENAPLILDSQGYVRDIDLSNRFAETLEELEERDVAESLEDRERFIRTFETTQNSEYLVTQFFQSPFHNDKTVLMFSGQDGNIKKELKQILDSKFRHKIRGDLVVSKLATEEQREIFNFNIKDDYFIGNLSKVSQFYFYISNNPILFLFISLFVIVLLTYLLRKTLLLYKARYHDDADAAG
jgi:hypothetical protein